MPHNGVSSGEKMNRKQVQAGRQAGGRGLSGGGLGGSGLGGRYREGWEAGWAAFITRRMQLPAR